MLPLPPKPPAEAPRRLPSATRPRTTSTPPQGSLWALAPRARLALLALTSHGTPQHARRWRASSTTTPRWPSISKVAAYPTDMRPPPPRLSFVLGEGKGSPPPSPSGAAPTATQGFAPQGPSTLQSRLRDRLPQPLRIDVGQHGSVARIHSACSVRSSRPSPLPPSPPSPVPVLIHAVEGRQLATRPRRQPALPRALPLPARRLPASGASRRLAPWPAPQLPRRETVAIARVQGRHYQPHRRRPDCRHRFYPGVADTLVKKPLLWLQQRAIPCRHCRVCGRGYHVLCLRQAPMAPVFAPAGSPGRIVSGDQPAGLRRIHVLGPRLDSGSRARLSTLR